VDDGTSATSPSLQLLAEGRFGVVDAIHRAEGTAAPRSSAELHTEGGFEVVPLKGNIGSQTYELPADLDLSGFLSVVISCRRFTMVFSTAELVLASGEGGSRR
jgi:Electron transfer DM13